MGRHFRPARVHQAATALLEAGRITQKPAWYDVVEGLTPAQTLVRTQPLPHQQRKNPKGTKKASKLFQPQKITYEEDILRKEFFKDHPWELARPRMILEETGADSHQTDWSQMQQTHKSLNGESVIQRQLWLLKNNSSMTRSEAYDQARKEFYDLRLQQDVERRVAKEEAQATGARFGKSVNEISMELEDIEHEKWKVWAAKQSALMNQKRAAMYTEFDNEDMALDPPSEETEMALEEVSDAIPAQGKDAMDGAKPSDPNTQSQPVMAETGAHLF